MSVMLGTVVETFEFLSIHLSADCGAPGRCICGLGFRPRRPPAITFMATTPIPEAASDSMAEVASGAMVKL